MGLLVLSSGLALSFVGGKKIVRNLPVSEETVVEEAKRALLGQQQTQQNQAGPSIGDSIEIQIWRSALEMRNEARKARRAEGIAFLLSGMVAILWGITILYNSRLTPDS